MMGRFLGNLLATLTVLGILCLIIGLPVGAGWVFWEEMHATPELTKEFDLAMGVICAVLAIVMTLVVIAMLWEDWKKRAENRAKREREQVTGKLRAAGFSEQEISRIYKVSDG